MKVGVLGSGDVAKVLASGLLKHGHQVKVGSRTTGKLADWASQNAGGSVGSFAEAAEFGEFVVLAVKGTAAAEALSLAGERNLAGKTVMDACNPIEDAAPENGVLRFFTGLNDSLMERLQRQFSSAQFRQGVQLRGQRVHDQSGVRRGQSRRCSSAETMRKPRSR